MTLPRSTQEETEMFQKNVKLPIGKIGAIAIAIGACIGLFDLVVPSKARVDELAARIQTLEVNTKADHDNVIKLSADVEYIRRWVEQQERKRQP